MRGHLRPGGLRWRLRHAITLLETRHWIVWTTMKSPVWISKWLLQAQLPLEQLMTLNAHLCKDSLLQMSRLILGYDHLSSWY